MFIERFFNPRVSTSDRVLYSTEDALKHCLDHYTYIRHHSFKGRQYIKNEDGVLVWNDGGKVDISKLPQEGKGWGRYSDEIHNLQSF